jgi:hypothetical protein
VLAAFTFAFRYMCFALSSIAASKLLAQSPESPSILKEINQFVSQHWHFESASLIQYIQDTILCNVTVLTILLLFLGQYLGPDATYIVRQDDCYAYRIAALTGHVEGIR